MRRFLGDHCGSLVHLEFNRHQLREPRRKFSLKTVDLRSNCSHRAFGSIYENGGWILSFANRRRVAPNLLAVNQVGTMKLEFDDQAVSIRPPQTERLDTIRGLVAVISSRATASNG